MENNRNWVELPSDVMLMILMKLQQQEILESIQFVCKPWYNVCKEPSLWRTIHFKFLTVSRSSKYVLNSDPPAVFNHEKMVYNAVDRSAGGLIELDIQGFMPYGIWSYVASRASQLKRLRLPSVGDLLSFEATIESLKKLSFLEEFQMYEPVFLESKELVFIVRSCPSLTTLKLNERGLRYRSFSCDNVAIAIAETMLELRHLQLIGNNLTVVGLTSILEGCSRLQFLDLRGCLHLKLDGDIMKRLQKQIKDLRCPQDTLEGDYYPSTDYSSDGYGIYYSNSDFDEYCDDYFGYDYYGFD